MSRSQLVFLIIPATIGSTIGTITAINDEVMTPRRYKFKIVPDIFQIATRISLGAETGAMYGVLWPIHVGLAAYNFIDKQSKLN